MKTKTLLDWWEKHCIAVLIFLLNLLALTWLYDILTHIPTTTITYLVPG